jgi:hypothetical protein
MGYYVLNSSGWLLLILVFLSILLLISTIIDCFRKIRKDSTWLGIIFDLFKGLNLICIALPVIAFLAYLIYLLLYIVINKDIPAFISSNS